MINTDLAGAIVAAVFILYIYYRFYLGYTGKESINLSDNFDIGYIKYNQPKISISVPIKKTLYKEDNKSKINILENEINILKNEINILKNPSKINSDNSKKTKKYSFTDSLVKNNSENITEKNKDNILFNECIQSLIVLGYKPKLAKQEVDNFLKNNKIQTAEEFIIQFFKKGK